MQCPVCEFPLGEATPAECSNCHTDLKPLQFVRKLPQSFLERARRKTAAGALRAAVVEASLAAALDPAMAEARDLVANLQESMRRRSWVRQGIVVLVPVLVVGGLWLHDARAIRQKVTEQTAQAARFEAAAAQRGARLDQAMRAKQTLATAFDRYRANHRYPNREVWRLRRRVRELKRDLDATRRQAGLPGVRP